MTSAPLCLVVLMWLGADASEVDRKGYVEQLEAWALASRGKEIDPSPQGKIIEEILIASEDVISPSDPWPAVLNAVHVRTREHVIRQEVLLAVGMPFDVSLANETERNLREMFILAVARVLPVKGSAPDRVSVLVVTKDLWSLRLNTSYRVVGPMFQYFRFEPSEENFLGRNKRVSLRFVYQRDSLTFGQSLLDRRVLGTRLQLYEEAGVFLTRQTGRGEGSWGSVILDRPFFSLVTPYAFSTSVGWVVRRVRLYRGAHIRALPYPDAANATAQLPYVYDARELLASTLYRRSFGDRLKTYLGAGVTGYSRRYQPPSGNTFTEDQRAWLVTNHFPRSEDAHYVFLRAELFEATWRVFRNVDTFALPEDWQLGHDVYLNARWAIPGLFPSRFVELGARAGYRWAFGENLTSASLGGFVRHVPGARGVGVESRWVKRHIAAQVVNYSPPLGIGRVVMNGLVDTRAADLDNNIVTLGGGNGLRGTEADQLVGDSVLMFNLEYRTRPIRIQTLHIGGVFFYDVGSAYFEAPRFTHTVGIGIRALVPQFDIEPWRFDFGYVVHGDRPPFVDRFSSSFQQVNRARPDTEEFLKRPSD